MHSLIGRKKKLKGKLAKARVAQKKLKEIKDKKKSRKLIIIMTLSTKLHQATRQH